MKIRPIKSQDDHHAALKAIERLWDAKEGTQAADRIEVLMAIVEAYEREHFPIDPPDPIEAIKFRLEQQGLGIDALIGVIGSRTRVYEVLPLTLAMIRRLHQRFGIPADILIREPSSRHAA